MKIRCPKCENAISHSEGVCSQCGFSLTVGSVFKHYAGQSKLWLGRATSIRCPECSTAMPLSSTTCPSCGLSITVEAATDPKKQAVLAYIKSISARAKLRLQLSYLLGSAVLLWWLLDYVFEKNGNMWFAHAALSFVLLAFFTLIFFWLVPRALLVRVAHGGPKHKPFSRIIKLALVFNYLSTLLLIQLAIGAWPMRASILAVLFVGSFFAFSVLHTRILTVWGWMAELFSVPQPPQYDPAAAQGRRVKIDEQR